MDRDANMTTTFLFIQEAEDLEADVQGNHFQILSRSFIIEWKAFPWFNVQRLTSNGKVYGQWNGGKKQSSMIFDGGKKLRKDPEIVTQYFPKPFWDTQACLEFEEGVATLSSNFRFRKLLKYAT